MEQRRVCVVGSLNMDLVAQTPRLPTAGETLIGGPFATFPGGKGANQAVAAACAGALVTMIGCVGDDGYGKSLRAGLAAAGIDIQYVAERPDVSSGLALITVAPGGQNTIIVAPGANAALTTEDIEQCSAAIIAAKLLLLQLEVPLSVVLRAAVFARAAGTTVVLNPAPAQSLPPEVLQCADILIPNETEAAALTGITPVDWSTAEAAARRLREMGASTVVLTLGSRGALLVAAEATVRQPAYHVDAVDATAAGDAFVGAFAVAIAEGRTPAEAMRWGAAAGALAATRHGAQPSLPARNAILALVEG